VWRWPRRSRCCPSQSRRPGRRPRPRRPPPSRAAAAGLTGGEDRPTRTSLPVPDGSDTVPRQHLVGLAGVDAQGHGQLDGFVELGTGQALHQLQRLRPGRRTGPGRPLRSVDVLLAFRHKWLPLSASPPGWTRLLRQSVLLRSAAALRRQPPGLRGRGEPRRGPSFYY
jgi:hypothetical protein